VRKEIQDTILGSSVLAHHGQPFLSAREDFKKRCTGMQAAGMHSNCGQIYSLLLFSPC
jgi:hypothetical protein